METPQQVQHLLLAELGAQHLVGPGNPEVQPGVLDGRGILIQALGGHDAGAHLAHELGGPLQGMDHPVGVHSPLEPVGGLGAEPQALGGPADGAGIEIGALQQHPGGGPGDLGIEPPHDPGQGHGPLGIANQQGLGVQVPLDAVQGGETALAALGQAHHDFAPPEALKVEGMQGLAELQQHVVGDIHQVVDGPQARHLEAAAHPEGRGRHGQPGHEAGGITGAVHRVQDGHPRLPARAPRPQPR